MTDLFQQAFSILITFGVIGLLVTVLLVCFVLLMIAIINGGDE